MFVRVFQIRRSVWWLGLLLCLPNPNCQADTLRVTTWNLAPATPAPGTAEPLKQITVAEAASVLKKLAPDVILLQQVRDWGMCEQLAQALKPADYRVLVCSAFSQPKAGAGGWQQAAVLARQRAYFAWSQSGKPEGASTLPGGFAFAAIETHGQRLAFFSVESTGGAVLARQLLAQVASIKGWITNRAQVFVVAGTFGAGLTDSPGASDAVRRLEAAGFADVVKEAAAAEQATPSERTGQVAARMDYIFTQPAACATKSRISSSEGAAHSPVTCELELDPARIAAAWAAQSEAIASRERVPAVLTRDATEALSDHPNPKKSTSSRFIITLALVGSLLLISLVRVLARRARASGPRTPRLLSLGEESGTAGASSYTVVVGAQSVTGPASPGCVATSTPPPIIHIEAPGTTHTQAEALRQRALAAEERAERATAALRSGVMAQLGRWLKQKLLRKLIADRAQLLEAQHAATAKAMTVEERLARVERQIQQQNFGYQQRIEGLTRELLAAKEENRELIRSQIRQVKAEMEAARARLLAQANEDDGR